MCYFGRKWDVSIGEHVSDRRAGFLSTKIRNFSNICKFHQPTRCYSCCCSTKRDTTAHFRIPAVQYEPDQLYAERHKRGIVASYQLSTRRFDLSYVVCRVAHASFRSQYSRRIPSIWCSRLVPRSSERLVTNWSSRHHWPSLTLSISYLLSYLVTNWTSRF